MTIIELQDASEGLADLVERAEAGEEILIARDGRAVVQLVPRRVDPPVARRKVGGLLRDDPWLTSIDLDAPLHQDVARAFGIIDELISCLTHTS